MCVIFLILLADLVKYGSATGIVRVEQFLIPLRSFVTTELNLWPPHLRGVDTYTAAHEAHAVRINHNELRFSYSFKHIQFHKIAEKNVTVDIFRSNPRWAKSGKPEVRYDDIEISTEEGSEPWYAKLLLILQYTHYWEESGSGTAVISRSSPTVCKETFFLAFVRSYYPDCSIRVTRRQPYLPLKFLPITTLSHHIVPLSTIMNRVHIIPRTPNCASAFFLNHYTPEKNA